MSERRTNRQDNALIEMLVGDKITPHLESLEQARLNALGARRYEYIRKLKLREISDLYIENIIGIASFDDLVDAAIAKELK